MKQVIKIVFAAVMLNILGAGSVLAEVVCNKSYHITNVRTGPSAKNYGVADSLSNGAQVEVIKRVTNEEGYDYYQVGFKHSRTGASKKGYIYHTSVSQNCAGEEATTTERKKPSIVRKKKRTSVKKKYVSNAFPKRLKLPSSMIITSKSGCKLLNPVPKPNETVEWTGKCIDGYAWGEGKVKWYKNGSAKSVEKAHLENGMWLTPHSVGHVGQNIIETRQGGKKCSFILPIDGADKHGKHFSIKYRGGCPKGGFSIMGSTKSKASVDIFLDGQMFAHFKGRVAGATIPVSGTMTFFSGAKFEFTDNVDFSSLTVRTRGKKWAQNIKSTPGSPGERKGKRVPADFFNIKVAMNADPKSAQTASGKLLVFSINTVASSADLKFNYQITPDKSKSLDAGEYEMVLRVSIGLTERTSLGWAGVSSKRNINKTVTISLKKEDGYSKNGTIDLGSLQTYLSGLGTEQKVSGIKPSVEVVSITESE